MNANVININPNILGGTPVFRGTRVPIQTLFDHLEEGLSIDYFLDDFPSVTREQAVEVLLIASRMLHSEKLIEQFDETFAWKQFLIFQTLNKKTGESAFQPTRPFHFQYDYCSIVIY